MFQMIKTPCAHCQAKLRVALEQCHAHRARDYLLSHCIENEVAAIIWLDRGQVVGWEIFSSESFEHAQRKIQMRIEAFDARARELLDAQGTAKKH